LPGFDGLVLAAAGGLPKSEKSNSKVIHPTGVCKAIKRIGAFLAELPGR
jgi:hypothetical protein